jgi:hypothetical protein
MRNWSSKHSLAALQKWHKQLGGDEWGLPEFEFAQKCSRAGLWQLAVTKGPYSKTPVTRYFLVNEGPGSHYEMVDISLTRQPGCPGKTPPDFTIRSLFAKPAER